MNLPILPPRILALLDALHIRVPLRTAVFGTIDFFRRLKIPFIRRTIRRLEAKKRAEIKATRRKIKVYFVCIDKSQWGMQSIFDSVVGSPLFDAAILAVPDWIRHSSKDPFSETISFFKAKGMRVVTTLDQCSLPDILFTPYFESHKLGQSVDIHELYKKTLLCLVMYSWIVTNSDKHFFGNIELTYFWRTFLFNSRELSVFNKLSPKLETSAVCVGFPRNDEILSDLTLPTTSSKFGKRLIWAPHWSILTHSRLGNFDRYAYPMLSWLKAHPNIEIVLKPHPFLRARLTDPETIKKLMFNNADFKTPSTFSAQGEYDQFISEWAAQPNGSVMDSGDYFDLFRSSDGMILDSGSFMAEYMVLNKPMCFCNRDRTLAELKAIFNGFGQDLLGGMTITTEWDQTADFLEAVTAGIDSKRDARSKLINTYLKFNERKVGSAITNNIITSLLPDLGPSNNTPAQ